MVSDKLYLILFLWALLGVVALIYVVYRNKKAKKEKENQKRKRRDIKEQKALVKEQKDVEKVAKTFIQINEEGEQSSSAPLLKRKGRASTVLLVEDSPTVMLMLRKTLERWNYKVITAENGKKAWAELQKKKPDLVVSDIDMPEMNGIELVQLMRSDLTFADIPVLLITGSLFYHMKASQEAGVNGLLQKPFDDKSLIDQIRYILQE